MLLRLGRALMRRCPNCGGYPIFRRFSALFESCPACGHRFERHEGYWLGAVAINTVAAIGVFFVVFVVGMVATWPDVPWNGLLIATVAVNVVFPIVFYPWSKTLWIALDLSIHPADDREARAAGQRVAGGEPG